MNARSGCADDELLYRDILVQYAVSEDACQGCPTAVGPAQSACYIVKLAMRQCANAAMASEGASGDGNAVRSMCEKWAESRRLRDFARADELRDELQGMGIPRTSMLSMVINAQLELEPEDRRSRMRSQQWLSAGACLAETIGYELAMALPRYGDLQAAEAFDVAETFGRALHAELLLRGSGRPDSSPPMVTLFKPFIEGFASGFRGAAKDCEVPVGFVLICVNGGDKPLTRAQQAVLASLPGLCACYATNLLVPSDPKRFLPLPLGLTGTTTPTGFDALIARTCAEAPPWAERDRRLLVGPMRVAGRGKLRVAFLNLLERPEFASLVRIVKHEDGRLSQSDFFALIASHRATLSPPGSGYDCLRTWQAVALGSVPLVVMDSAFDPRLWERTGAAAIDRPEVLTPESLSAVLDGLVAPEPEYAVALEMRAWRRVWTEACNQV